MLPTAPPITPCACALARLAALRGGHVAGGQLRRPEDRRLRREVDHRRRAVGAVEEALEVRVE